MRTFHCPIPDYDGVNDDGDPDYYITLPPRWLGSHAMAKDEAVDSGEKAGLKGVILTFAVSLALAEDYKLPGLDGKPDNWDFSLLDLELITWTNFIVWGSFNRDLTVKKNYLLASMNGNVRAVAEILGATGDM